MLTQEQPQTVHWNSRVGRVWLSVVRSAVECLLIAPSRIAPRHPLSTTRAGGVRVVTWAKGKSSRSVVLGICTRRPTTQSGPRSCRLADTSLSGRAICLQILLFRGRSGMFFYLSPSTFNVFSSLSAKSQ